MQSIVEPHDTSNACNCAHAHWDNVEELSRIRDCHLREDDYRYREQYKVQSDMEATEGNRHCLSTQALDAVRVLSIDYQAVSRRWRATQEDGPEERNQKVNRYGDKKESVSPFPRIRYCAGKALIEIDDRQLGEADSDEKHGEVDRAKS